MKIKEGKACPMGKDSKYYKEKKKEPRKHRALKRAMRRIRIGQWGEWSDLITEMDGHDSNRHL